jgi:UDP-N-acetylglucosamine 2-epimerase
VAAIAATRHYVPTRTAKENLLREGVAESLIVETGNTVVDALQYMVAKVQAAPPDLPSEVHSILGQRSKLVLITGHRRENFGTAFQGICSTIKRLAEQFPETAFVYPVHLNPNVKEPATQILGATPGIVLCEPLSYRQMVYLMRRANVLLTDSGGIQEEGVSLGKPVLVMRQVTERPEGVEAGLARLVGVSPEKIFDGVADFLGDGHLGARSLRSPYGDGRAAERIVQDLHSQDGQTRPSILATRGTLPPLATIPGESKKVA